MKNKKIIIISILIIFLILISTQIYATSILDKGKSFIKEGENSTYKDAIPANLTSESKTRFEELSGMVWGIGVGVSLIATVIIGIKYILASTEQRAELKTAMVPYVIGISVIFGATTIWQMLIHILELGIK